MAYGCCDGSGGLACGRGDGSGGLACGQGTLESPGRLQGEGLPVSLGADQTEVLELKVGHNSIL